ncbi:triose-phosphate isomerase [Candidatus Berkiella aquae]|uniref:Triosephosphate isomerase n=1 Tax=Candidatus Berkiella aquae TaxID=295108 RepID=A0A0Q9YM58_9GAMM|nr:triose-phosphate isomerase [Candidatus Berkiella aquae]MCS5710489.1 triose-phosphate isomerase [Candidatus Berkiella aquae]
MQANRARYVIGNWKMNGSQQHVAAFFDRLSQVELPATEMVVCPPSIYLSQAAQILKPSSQIKLGAQDVSAHPPGAYTGQISASMLIEQGCRYAIVGHSERREYNKETDADVAAKFLAAKLAGLTPILCVGETHAQRLAEQTDKVVVSQLNSILSHHGADVFEGALLAYEPIWAIGTGLTATPEQAQAVHHLLRETIGGYDSSVAARLPILYGGSVKASNAAALFSMPDIDGALVGGASLQAEEFLAICESNK